MIFEETKLKGAFVIKIEKREDPRGFFARTWCRREFNERGLNSHFVQANIAVSWKKGTLRGMHYQASPFQEAKLFRCIKGSIFDVIIDLRSESPTYKDWLGVELNSEDYTMIYAPERFAHGYQTLSDETEIFYPVSAFYSPESERGVRWNDPAFGIEWPETDNLVISEKDKNWADYLP